MMTTSKAALEDHLPSMTAPTLSEGARTYHAYIKECSGLYMSGLRTARAQIPQRDPMIHHIRGCNLTARKYSI